jgi:hypothetical protein
VADPFFRWLEGTSLSVWTRESTSVFAFPAILSAHAIGMALAAGISGAIALRLLGVARTVSAARMLAFAPLLWAGFGLNALSGLVLLVAYPTKALTNPVFYIKLCAIGVGMTTLVLIRRRLDKGGPGSGFAAPAALRLLAATSLAAWTVAIVAGRLLAYTHHRLLVDH